MKSGTKIHNEDHNKLRITMGLSGIANTTTLRKFGGVYDSINLSGVSCN